MKRLLIAAILLSSCAKKVVDCEGLYQPTVVTNTPIVTGGELQLSVAGAHDVYMYNWYGPDNFYSKAEAPVVKNLTSDKGGMYFVDVITNGGCIYTIHTDSISIAGAVLSCDIPENTYALQTLPVSFYYVSANVSASQYVVAGNSNYQTVRLQFYTKDGTLPAGVYIPSTTVPSFYTDAGKVYLTIGQFVARDGKVYVNVQNGKTTVAFCDVTFSVGNGTTTGSAHMTFE